MSNEPEVKKAVCTMCHSRCRVSVYSENGRLVKIEEDLTWPKAKLTYPPVAACMRLHGAKEWMYQPDRVHFPMKRAGERGEGKWERISWNQAFDEIAENLGRVRDKYGGESIAFTGGTGRTFGEHVSRFMHLLGSTNQIGPNNVCYVPVLAVATAMLGWSVRHRSMRPIEIGGGIKAGTRCIFLIGINPAQSIPPLWKAVREGSKIGVKLIVVDPRKTESAGLADSWLQLRPGTDTALLMSMIHVIIEEGLYDKEFVDRWCYGFDKVVERAREYPPEKVAEITRVPAEKIREASRMYATNGPALTVHGMGMEHLQNSIQAIQARFILCAITGNVDAEGSDYMPGPSKLTPFAEITGERLLSQEQKMKQIGSDRFKLLTWPGRDLMQQYVKEVWGQECGVGAPMASAHAPMVYRAMLTGKPYPVRAAMTSASNPMVTQPNVKLVYKALKSLDFYVVTDFWMTACAEIADYVLPVATWLERPWLGDGGGVDCDFFGGEQALPSAIPGEYDHKTDFEIYRELGMRLGQEGYWPWESVEELFDYRLKPMGMTFKEFMAQGGFHFPPREYRKYEKRGFATPTGKLELSSTIFEKLGYDPLPRYEESHENPISTPELAKEYPLVLITGGRFHPMFHSEYFNIETTRKRHPNPLVQINRETASKLDIVDGDWVWIETRLGRIRMKCQYFSGIDPRVVHCEHGWWFPELPGEEPWLHGVWESNVNVLTDDNPDYCNELSGGWPLKTSLCKVYKVKQF